MLWTDSYEIAMALEEKYPHVDILGVRFTDLSAWVQGLDGFEGVTHGCSESILEAIQMAWLDEREG